MRTARPADSVVVLHCLLQQRHRPLGVPAPHRRAPRTANVGLIRLLAAGALDLAPEQVRSFPREAVNEAVAYAVSHGGPFERTALVP